ncbi:MAG: hypothetical protein SNF33_05280 [Candidatus Algichlamydia australiensis]|nr:hypothetical protein [Chlamydiales bacterium]
MLNRAAFITFSLLLSAIAFSSYTFTTYNEKDIANFLQWKQCETTPSHDSPLHQVKKEVQKDLYLTEENQQRHVQIAHKGSFLTYSSETGAHEELYGIVGYVQEEANDGACDVRQFSSNRGTYSLSDHKFRTEEVLMTFYQAQSSAMNEESVAMRGKAKSVELSLEDKDLRMNAEHFRVTIPKERAHAIFE